LTYCREVLTRIGKIKPNIPKPILVLDVDETMIFSCNHKDEALHDLDHMCEIGNYTLQIKLRPGILELLQWTQHNFDMWIYSNGNEQYIRSVVRFLETKDVKFAEDHVITRKNQGLNKQISK
jgi:TFIIF-interacting CTD phosphatase-like protein